MYFIKMVRKLHNFLASDLNLKYSFFKKKEYCTGVCNPRIPALMNVLNFVKLSHPDILYSVTTLESLFFHIYYTIQHIQNGLVINNCNTNIFVRTVGTVFLKQ